jgi:hypothetical protein
VLLEDINSLVPVSGCKLEVVELGLVGQNQTPGVKKTQSIFLLYDMGHNDISLLDHLRLAQVRIRRR